MTSTSRGAAGGVGAAVAREEIVRRRIRVLGEEIVSIVSAALEAGRPGALAEAQADAEEEVAAAHAAASARRQRSEARRAETQQRQQQQQHPAGGTPQEVHEAEMSDVQRRLDDLLRRRAVGSAAPLAPAATAPLYDRAAQLAACEPFGNWCREPRHRREANPQHPLAADTHAADAATGAAGGFVGTNMNTHPTRPAYEEADYRAGTGAGCVLLETPMKAWETRDALAALRREQRRMQRAAEADEAAGDESSSYFQVTYVLQHGAGSVADESAGGATTPLPAVAGPRGDDDDIFYFIKPVYATAEADSSSGRADAGDEAVLDGEGGEDRLDTVDLRDIRNWIPLLVDVAALGQPADKLDFPPKECQQRPPKEQQRRQQLPSADDSAVDEEEGENGEGRSAPALSQSMWSQQQQQQQREANHADPNSSLTAADANTDKGISAGFTLGASSPFAPSPFRTPPFSSLSVNRNSHDADAEHDAEGGGGGGAGDGNDVMSRIQRVEEWQQGRQMELLYNLQRRRRTSVLNSLQHGPAAGGLYYAQTRRMSTLRGGPSLPGSPTAGHLPPRAAPSSPAAAAAAAISDAGRDDRGCPTEVPPADAQRDGAPAPMPATQQPQQQRVVTPLASPSTRDTDETASSLTHSTTTNTNTMTNNNSNNINNNSSSVGGGSRHTPARRRPPPPAIATVLMTTSPMGTVNSPPSASAAGIANDRNAHPSPHSPSDATAGSDGSGGGGGPGSGQGQNRLSFATVSDTTASHTTFSALLTSRNNNNNNNNNSNHNHNHSSNSNQTARADTAAAQGVSGTGPYGGNGGQRETLAGTEGSAAEAAEGAAPNSTAAAAAMVSHRGLEVVVLSHYGDFDQQLAQLQQHRGGGGGAGGAGRAPYTTRHSLDSTEEEEDSGRAADDYAHGTLSEAAGTSERRGGGLSQRRDQRMRDVSQSCGASFASYVSGGVPDYQAPIRITISL